MRILWSAFAAGATMWTSMAAASVEDGLAALQAGDVDAAFEAFREEAEAGNPDAQFNLAFMLVTARFGEQDFAEALDWLVLSVEQDHPPSLLLYGRMHEVGLGVEQDIPVALETYERAADLGVVRAATLLERQACWEEPTPICLLDIAESELSSDGFAEVVPGRTILALASAWLDADELDRGARLLGAVATMQLGPAQIDRLLSLHTDLAVSLAAAGRSEEAQDIIAAIDDPIQRALAHARLAAHAADSAETDAAISEAELAIESMNNPLAQANGLVTVAVTLIESGLSAEAEPVIAAALDILPAPTAITLPEINRVRADAAIALASLGDFDAAIDLAEEAGGSVPTVWSQLAEHLARDGRTEDAVEMLEQVPATADRVSIGLTLLEQLDSAGQFNALLEAVQQGLAQIDADNVSGPLSRRLASILASEGRVAAALAILPSVPTPLGQRQTLSDIASIAWDQLDRPSDASAVAALLYRSVTGSESAWEASADLGDASESVIAALEVVEADLLPVDPDSVVRNEAVRLAAAAVARATAEAPELLADIDGFPERTYATLTVAASADSVAESVLPGLVDDAAARLEIDSQRLVRDIAVSMAQTGRIDDSMRAIRRVDEPRYFAYGLMSLAGALGAADGSGADEPSQSNEAGDAEGEENAAPDVDSSDEPGDDADAASTGG